MVQLSLTLKQANLLSNIIIILLFSTYPVAVRISISSAAMVHSPSIEAGEVFHPSTLAVFGDSCQGEPSSSDDVEGIIFISKSTGITNK